MLSCWHRHAGSTEQVVLRQLTRTLATVLKRGWTSESDESHRKFFEELDARVAAQDNAAARRLNIEILEVGA